MSDSTLESPPREAGMERRNRLLFGFCLVLVLIAVFLAASVWLYVDHAKKLTAGQHRTTGRLLADQVMLIRHWTELEDAPEFRSVVDDLTKRFGNQQQYRWNLIRPLSEDPSTRPGDEFEQQVLNRFLKAEPPDRNAREYAERLVRDQNEYQYYQPIRAEESCLAVCHKPASGEAGLDAGEGPKGLEGTGGGVTLGGKPLAEGDLMAVVKIAIPYVSAN